MKKPSIPILIIAASSPEDADTLRDAVRRDFPQQIVWTCRDTVRLCDALSGRVPPTDVQDHVAPAAKTMEEIFTALKDGE